jgi:hypothetical protein
MPEKKTIKRARKAKREGKASSTQAGEFVRAEIHNIREGKHGARSAKQAIAIGLSEARRAGVKLERPAKGKAPEKTREKAERDLEKGQKHAPVSKTRSKARLKALKKEKTSSASHAALSRQARSAAKKRTGAERSKAAQKAVRTKGPKKLSEAAKKAAHTRELEGA